jgi:putative hydrolase of the HAD superfamily
MSSFAHVRTWVFDLDNTLYPPGARLFDQISARMTVWVMRNLTLERAAADALRRDYWARHGTTLAGLMAEHGVEPAAFLEDVHDIDLGVLSGDPGLAEALAALPGRRIVHTNADRAYAGRVLAARGIAHLFDAVYGVEETGFAPKPGRAAFDRVIALDGYEPSQAAMFEDEARNLAVPHALGMRTVHVASEPETAPHVGHWTDDLSGFLRALTEAVP